MLEDSDIATHGHGRVGAAARDAVDVRCGRIQTEGDEILEGEFNALSRRQKGTAREAGVAMRPT